jgi:hypothetical protein
MVETSEVSLKLAGLALNLEPFHYQQVVMQYQLFINFIVS